MELQDGIASNIGVRASWSIGLSNRGLYLWFSLRAVFLSPVGVGLVSGGVCAVSESDGDHAPVLSTGEAAPRVLCSVLGLALQEGRWVAGVCPEKGNEAGEGSGEQVFWGAAEGAGAVQYAEEEAEGRPYCSLQLPGRRL